MRTHKKHTQKNKSSQRKAHTSGKRSPMARGRGKRTERKPGKKKGKSNNLDLLKDLEL